MNITTKSNQLILALMVLFFSLMLACKSKDEVVTPPNQPPGNFNVTSTLSTNGQDVILKWTKSKDPDGDAVTYSVVYTDTLAKNLSDTTYTIKNLPFETEIKGSVVAKDTKGSKSISNFSIKTGVGYISIPDAKFETVLIKLKIDDIKDGKVLKSNVDNILYLDVSNPLLYFGDVNNNTKIKDLTGIEAFTKLETLICSNVLLKYLDISKNIALKELFCRANYLESLDVSKNINLIKLDCQANNLKTLDVSKNVSLTLFFCNSNQLKSLDVSKLTGLIDFACDENQISNLDVSKNISLRFPLTN